jgi:hypothetical protein
VFHTDIARVDQHVAYIAMVVPVCCKHLFLIFHLFSRRMLQSVFIWMLHMFHTYVISVLSGCCVCLQYFLSVFYVFQMYVSSVTSVFFYVASVISRCFKSRLVVAYEIRVGSRRGREQSPRERAPHAARAPA